MERETFLHIAERASRYPNVRRRGQLVRAVLSHGSVDGAVRAGPREGRGPTFFVGLADRAADYIGCAET
jgi:hypothetical protein